MKPLLILIVIIALAYGISGVVRDHKMQAGFAAIQPGSSEQSVRTAMGRPTSADHSCAAYGNQVIGACDHVYVYRSAFAPLRFSYWLVFFDTTDHATAKLHQLHP